MIEPEFLEQALKEHGVRVVKCIDEGPYPMEPTKIYRCVATVGDQSIPFDASYELLKEQNLI